MIKNKLIAIGTAVAGFLPFLSAHAYYSDVVNATSIAALADETATEGFAQFRSIMPIGIYWIVIIGFGLVILGLIFGFVGYLRHLGSRGRR